MHTFSGSAEVGIKKYISVSEADRQMLQEIFTNFGIKQQMNILKQQQKHLILNMIQVHQNSILQKFKQKM
jgi:hypothetical protein